MGLSALNIGISGLYAAQIGLATTSHNIANASTPGYSRQTVVQTTVDPQFSGSGYMGRGVAVQDVRRSYSDFLSAQVLAADARSNELTTYSSQISQLDSLLADTQAGLSPALSSFFSAVQDLSANPSSGAARQSLISSGNALAARFNALDSRMAEINDNISHEISRSVDSINTLAAQIADLNTRIVAAQAGSAGVRLPNDLLDQRDELIGQLNQQVRVTTLKEDNGNLNVFIGNGQPMVVGSSAFNLVAVGGLEDVTRTEVAYANSNGTTTRLQEGLLSGGSLGALLSFRTETLEPARNSLGRVAVGLADSFNDQHQLGQDLLGNLGGLFFAAPSLRAVAGTTNSSAAAAQVSVTLGSVDKLTTSDYRLSYDGTNYTLLRLSDSTSWSAATLSGVATAADQGFTLSQSPAMASGDTFLVQPTRLGAANMRVAITDPRLVAAATPVRTASTSSNTGTGAISAGSVSTTTGLPMAASPGGDITLTFNSALNQFTVTGGPGGTLAYNPATDSAGKTFNFATVGGFSFTMTGTPANGDTFVIQANASGVGDNRNALALGGLQTAKILAGSTAGLQTAYSQLVSDVGNKAREVQVTGKAQETLLSSAKSARDSVSGVNLDDEAANLLRYQQAYQASAKTIQIAEQVFQSILALGN